MGSQLEIPGLTPRARCSSADLQIEFRYGVSPPVAPSRWPEHYRRAVASEGDLVALTIRAAPAPQVFWLDYGRGLGFVMLGRQRRILAYAPQASEHEEVSALLLGPVLGFWLKIRGVLCLHASAVAAGAQVLALAGPSGAGKSTTAAALCALGWSPIADDLLAVREVAGRPRVASGPQGLRLWPSGASLLGQDPQALSPIFVGSNKRVWRSGPTAADTPQGHPLGGVAVLAPGSPGGEGCRVEALGPAAAVLALASNVYGNLATGIRGQAEALEAVVRLVSEVPVWRVSVDRPRCSPAEVASALTARFGGL